MLQKVKRVGGETCFGSELSYAESKKCMDVNSDFIAENNTTFFRRLLKARHGDRPSDHWVDTTAAMNDVKTIEIACTWSQRDTSYFVSTFKSTKIHEDKRIAKLEDYFGNVTCKEINRPSIRHNLCEVLLTLDEHDRMRKMFLVQKGRG